MVGFRTTLTRDVGIIVQGSRVNVMGATNQWTGEHSGLHLAGEQLVFRVSFENVLAPERYHATPAIAHRGTGAAWIDRREQLVSVLVTGTISTDAAVLVPFQFALEEERAVARAEGR